MRYLLDTSVAIVLRDGDPGAARRLDALTGKIEISSVTLVELEGGVYSDRADGPLRRALLDNFLLAIDVLPFDAEAAVEYGRIVAARGYSRPKIVDRMIAAHAVSLSATLATLNAKDFANIPGLTLDAWA